MQYRKVKSVAKVVTPNGNELRSKVLGTMKRISDIVGATLGPGGMPVLIERQEENLPALVTKDGVTVFRHLGFEDPAAHVIMETARDASVRTASEAGDGTTTATVLSQAIVENLHKYCLDNPKISPQRVVRELEAAFKEVIEPLVRSMAIKASLDEQGVKLLKTVAKVSANGDEALADAVMQCFDIVGDEGNVTISETSGPSEYRVEQVEGYPIPMGYEESCAKFYPNFINDPGTQRCFLEKPVFILYHGRLTEIQTVLDLLSKVGQGWKENSYHHHNVVLITTGFSESVLGHLAINFADPTTINIFPLLAPQSAHPNGQLHFLEDMAAITGAELFDPLNKPLGVGTLEDLGPGIEYFEASRYRSTAVGYADEDLLLVRVDEVKTMLRAPESNLDRIMLEERLGKLTGGIARLIVVGASNGELKEKRDRAEDAVCAVRGALKQGCLPGGGFVLLMLSLELYQKSDVLKKVLAPAMKQPFYRLLSNCGYNTEEISDIENNLYVRSDTKVFDAMKGDYVDPMQDGVLDSLPAVLEAIRSSLSVASLLGTLGGTVVYKRDDTLERSEAVEAAEWNNQG